MTADPRAVEIIGVAIRDHETSEYHVKTYDDGPGWATTCECGWSVRGEDYAAWDAHRAESVAVALDAAGWSLLPPGGRTRDLLHDMESVAAQLDRTARGRAILRDLTSTEVSNAYHEAAMRVREALALHRPAPTQEEP